MKSRSTNSRQNEQGSILVLSLMVSLILLGLGLTAMWLSSESGTVATNISRRGEAYYTAQSALERARGILMGKPNWKPMLEGCPTSADWTSEMVDNDNDSGSGKGRGRVLCAADVPLHKVRMFQGMTSGGKVGSLNTIEYTLWIRNDDDEGGTASVDDKNTRVVLRAEATARGNLGFVALEQIIGRGGGGALPESAYSQAGMGPTGSNSGKAALAN